MVICKNHESSWFNKATPLLIQRIEASSFSQGILVYITKLLEAPVVVKIPFLSEVLYTGHS